MNRYITEYLLDGRKFMAEVDALDLAHAQQQGDARGRGETVLGVLYTEIKASEHFGPRQADKLIQRFAESGEEDPPESSEFPRPPIEPNPL